jgi:hypothetical protein
LFRFNKQAILKGVIEWAKGRIMVTGISKICCACGQDVSEQKRVKDPKGRYYCHPCWASTPKSPVLTATPATPVSPGSGIEKTPAFARIEALASRDMKDIFGGKTERMTTIALSALMMLGSIVAFVLWVPAESFDRQPEAMVWCGVYFMFGLLGVATPLGVLTRKPKVGDALTVISSASIVAGMFFVVMGSAVHASVFGKSEWVMPIFWVVILSSLGVALHSGYKKIPVDQKKPYAALTNGWLRWLAACLALWIVSVPLYLYVLFTKYRPPTQVVAENPPHENVERQLRTLKAMRDDGVLTEEEWMKKKTELLGIRSIG